MNHFLLLVSILGMAVFAKAQMYNAVCTGAGESMLMESSDISVVAEKSRSQLIVGWPKAFSKDEYYMNARGLCLADLDGNGTDEIIFGADTAIYAYKPLACRFARHCILSAFVCRHRQRWQLGNPDVHASTGRN